MISDQQQCGGSPDRDDVYSLAEGKIEPPALPGEARVCEDVDSLIDAIAADLVVHAENCVREFGDFHLALSGGSTPEPLYDRLMYDPNYRRLPWRRTQLWIVDERCVDFDDERSNFRMIRESIVEHSDIPPDQVHPIMAQSPTAAEDYEAKLREVLAWREKGQDRLDYVLLGMGADGHTASLFPGSAALSEPAHLVSAVHNDLVDPPDRITMTYNLINAARFIGVMVAGQAKAAMIARVAGGEDSSDELPIKGIVPLQGHLRWYLDRAACGMAGE